MSRGAFPLSAARRAALARILAGAAAALVPSVVSGGRPWRVGTLDNLPRSYPVSFTRNLVVQLEKLGYREGAQFEVVHRWSDWKYERLPGLAAELVAARPQVIATNNSDAAQALVEATTTIPIVAYVVDPIIEGFAVTLARPGRNVTGVSSGMAERGHKTVAFLRQMAPSVERLGIVVRADQRDRTPYEVIWSSAARDHGLAHSVFAVRTRHDVIAAFKALRGLARAAAVVPWALPRIMYPDDIEKWDEGTREIGQLALENGVATIAIFPPALTQGGLLMTYSPAQLNNNATMAELVVKILRGIPAGEIPFQLPVGAVLGINVKTAKALGLQVPQELLLRADYVVE